MNPSSVKNFYRKVDGHITPSFCDKKFEETNNKRLIYLYTNQWKKLNFPADHLNKGIKYCEKVRLSFN